MAACTQLLNYIATHPNASIRYCASDMILALNTDASYLTEPGGGESRAAEYIYLRKQHDDEFHNDAILVLSGIIKHIMTSTSET